MIEDTEDTLVLAGTVQVFAQPGATANHLPKFYIRLQWLGKDEVDHLRHIDSSVKHVHGHCNGQIMVGIFEIIYELLGTRIVVVDDLAKFTSKLRIHLVK
ncbi:hypothetical protein DSECCO2_555140 [anaerobic digester metagenome]